MVNLPDIRRPSLRGMVIARELSGTLFPAGLRPYQRDFFNHLMHRAFPDWRLGRVDRRRVLTELAFCAPFGVDRSGAADKTVVTTKRPHRVNPDNLGNAAEAVGRVFELILIDDIGMSPRDAWKRIQLGVQYGKGYPTCKIFAGEVHGSNRARTAPAMIVSRGLFSFLQAWMAWATNGAPHGQPFSRGAGLCGSLVRFARPDTKGLYNELLAFFETQNPDTQSYPFGRTEYLSRRHGSTQHLDPRRLAWVQARIDDYYRSIGQ